MLFISLWVCVSLLTFQFIFLAAAAVAAPGAPSICSPVSHFSHRGRGDGALTQSRIKDCTAQFNQCKYSH